MLQTYQTRLTNKTQLSPNTVLFRFDLQEPGEIIFTAGQYVIMDVPSQTEAVKRLYSIASSPLDKNSLELLVHIIPDGAAGKYFTQMEIGDSVAFEGPAGVFTIRENDHDKIFLATGSGIAPMRSMIKSVIIGQSQLESVKISKNNPEPIPTDSNRFQPILTNYYLFWGVPYYKDAYLFKELKEQENIIRKLNNKVIKEENNSNYSITLLPNYFQFKICLSREQNLDIVPDADKKYFMLGHVTDEVKQVIIGQSQSESVKISKNNPEPIPTDSNRLPPILPNYDFYICSGREVTESLKQFVEKLGAVKEQVYFEKF